MYIHPDGDREMEYSFSLLSLRDAVQLLDTGSPSLTRHPLDSIRPHSQSLALETFN